MGLSMLASVTVIGKHFDKYRPLAVGIASSGMISSTNIGYSTIRVLHSMGEVKLNSCGIGLTTKEYHN